MPCWYNYASSPDLFDRNPSSPPPLQPACQIPTWYSAPKADSWSGSGTGNDHFLGLSGAAYTGGLQEAIQIMLSTPLATGNWYQLTFYARIANQGQFFQNAVGAIDICGSSNNLPPVNNYNNTNTGLLSFDNLTPSNIFVDNILNDNNWHKYTLSFQYNNPINSNFLIIANAAYRRPLTSRPIYIYLDDIDIKPLDNVVTFILPATWCQNVTLSNLSQYVQPVNLPTGVFSGAGVSFDGTNYNFNATHTGINIISYTYELNGCQYTIDQSINVIGGISLSTLVIAPCESQCNGSITVTPSGGNTPYSYHWSVPGINTNSASSLCNGNYTITVLDEDNCPAIVNIQLNDLPASLDLGPDICITPTTTIDAGSGYATYDWLFPNGNHSYTQIISVILPGLYSVAVTASNGCTSAGSIYVDQPATANFTISPSSCQYIGSPVTFSVNTPVPNTVYQWELGGLPPHTGTVFTHTFSESGYYCISLTATNACGTEKETKKIFVMPSSCACTQTYNTTDGDFVPPNATSYWDGVASPYYVEGTFTVYENAELIIKYGSTIRFAPNARIIVKKKGKLTIMSGTITNPTVLTGLGSTCEFMWQGIEVEGSLTQPPTELYQGCVSIEQNVVIENAHIGILLGLRNMDALCTWQPGGFPFKIYSGGSIIKTTGENIFFINNGTDIKILPRKPYNLKIDITKCNFTCTELIDPSYLITNTNPYPNTRNPWAPQANEYQRSDAGIWMTWNDVFNFDNCTLINKQHGIHSYTSKYNVYKCIFDNMKYGIKIENYLSTLTKNHEISYCNFTNTPGDPPGSKPAYSMYGAAIYVSGGLYDFIHDNRFGTINTTDPYIEQQKNFDAITMLNASAFKITENEIRKYRCGVKVTNSGNNGAAVRALNTNNIFGFPPWRGNVFIQCRTSIITNDNNPKLMIKCNQSDNAGTDINSYVVNYSNMGTLGNQGMGSIFPSWFPTLPIDTKRKYAAGNWFEPSLDNYRKISTFNSFPYTYTQHTNPIEVKPYVPAGIPISISSVGVDFGLSRDITCDDPFTKIINPVSLQSPEILKLDSLINRVITLESEKSVIETNLDKGRTSELLLDIYINRLSNGKLKNKLIECSPLSDTVVNTLIVRYPLSHGNFKNVMEYNLPVSRNNLPWLLERLRTIPQGIAMQIKELQGYNPYVYTVSTYENEIERIEQERQLYLNEIIWLLTDSVNNRKDDAIALLESEQNIHSDLTLAATYLGDENITLATNKLSQISPADEATTDWINYSELLLTLLQNGKTIFEMDSTDIQYMYYLANKCPVSLAGSNARAILSLLFNADFDDCPANEARGKLFLPEPVYAPEDCYLGENYPDPFTDKTIIPYFLPETQSGRIIITDITGRIVADIVIPVGEGTVEISAGKWADGVYQYSLEVNGKISETRKMVLVK